MTASNPWLSQVTGRKMVVVGFFLCPSFFALMDSRAICGAFQAEKRAGDGAQAETAATLLPLWSWLPLLAGSDELNVH